jgi:hypothetical protein
MALRRFAKRWYKLRAMGVFCGQTGIAAASNLPPKFRVALDDGMISGQQMLAFGSAFVRK